MKDGLVWEYDVRRLRAVTSLARVVDDLDAAGKNGWELVSAHWHDEATVTMTLKRPRFPVIDAKED